MYLVIVLFDKIFIKKRTILNSSKASILIIIPCWRLDLLLNILKLSLISLVTENSGKSNLLSATAEVENSLNIVI